MMCLLNKFLHASDCFLSMEKNKKLDTMLAIMLTYRYVQKSDFL